MPRLLGPGEGASPLDAAGVPVFQVALATNDAAGRWAEASAGLSPADLAMHVVLPEVDGRIWPGWPVVQGIRQAPDPELQFARTAHVPDTGRIDAIAGRVAAGIGWQRPRGASGAWRW